MTNEEPEDRFLEFAAGVGTLVEALPDTRVGRHAAGQLIACGTSPAPNYEEACAAESRRDFVHKVLIALKELRETRFWLRFVERTRLATPAQVDPLLNECGQLCRILGKSAATAKRNMESEKAKS
jgi:four helix bundle protein